MYDLHKICHRPEIDCPRKIPCLLIARQNSANLRSPSLSSFGPDRFLSVSLSVSGLAGRLNQRRELGCFLKSELQGGHKLRYNFPCGQFQVNSEIGMLWKISCWFCDYYNEEIAGHQIVATNGSATKLVCLMSTELAFKGHAMLCREYFETKNSCWRRIRSDF